MADDEVIYEVDDGVAWLTINRPEARNALNKAVRDGLWDGVRDVRRATTTPRVLILTGAGDKAFCAGGDLKEMAGHGAEGAAEGLLRPPATGRSKIDEAGDRRGQRRTPSRAASCSPRWSTCASPPTTRSSRSPRSRSGAGRRGRRRCRGSSARGWRWRSCSPAQPINAQRAYEIGLVNQVVPLDELREEAGGDGARDRRQRAAVGARRPRSWSTPRPIAAGRRALDAADEIYEPVYLSEDGQEGPRAFSEKRKPVWKGR